MFAQSRVMRGVPIKLLLEAIRTLRRRIVRNKSDRLRDANPSVITIAAKRRVDSVEWSETQPWCRQSRIAR